MSNSENDTTKTTRLQLNLIPTFLFHPSIGFSKLTTIRRNSWLAPILITSLAVILCILTTGWLKQQTALTGNIDLPPDFDYFTPEQQAQYVQATQATQSPIFIYVLPLTGSLLGLWLMWLLIGGTLHLTTTLFGGRGGTAASMNLVAWSYLPFALRNFIRFIYMIISRRLIESPGLSGFISSTETNWSMIMATLFGLIDIYLIWHIILLVMGVKITSGLSTVKSIGSVLITILFTVGLQVSAQFLITKLSNLSVTRPFFF
jgi:hypothetical protein